jgi:hypothetical protein
MPSSMDSDREEVRATPLRPLLVRNSLIYRPAGPISSVCRRLVAALRQVRSGLKIGAPCCLIVSVSHSRTVLRACRLEDTSRRPAAKVPACVPG